MSIPFKGETGHREGENPIMGITTGGGRATSVGPSRVDVVVVRMSGSIALDRRGETGASDLRDGPSGADPPGIGHPTHWSAHR